MTTEKEREIAIRYIIEQIHTPRAARSLQKFLVIYGKHIQQALILSQQIGIPTCPPPPVYNFSDVTEALIRDLLTYEEVYNKIKAQQQK